MNNTQKEIVKLAATSEYTQDKLHKAAEIVLLAYQQTEADVYSKEAMDDEISHITATLAHGGPLKDSTREFRRWRALEITNLPMILASSSYSPT